MANRHITQVGKLRPKLNRFNLSYRVMFDCDMGWLVPVQADMCIPGDIWRLQFDIVSRMQPPVRPILQEINIDTHTFFIPLRLVDENIEDSLTGGEEGEYTGDDVLTFPKWNSTGTLSKYSLWDMLGFPIKKPSDGTALSTTDFSNDRLPVDWLRRAYYLVYDEFYRDENVGKKYTGKKKDPDATRWSDPDTVNNGGKILNRYWKKDYFTAALKETQKGTSPALPITGTTQTIFDIPTGERFTEGYWYGSTNGFRRDQVWTNPYANSPSSDYPLGSDNGLYYAIAGTGQPTDNGAMQYGMTYDSTNTVLNKFNTIDLSTASTFDVADLREIVQVQKWLERNARAGSRYFESLISRFPVNPQDYRLQRPEFIGGTRQPMIISEVRQTGQPTNASSIPQGDLAGHGISASRGGIRPYKCQEHGIMLTLLSIMPKRNYTQGIDRQWQVNDLYDMVFPEFAHLGEREVRGAEIVAGTGPTGDDQIISYRGIYDEHRGKLDRVMGDMRDTQKNWAVIENYTNVPQLNDDFLKCNPPKDIFVYTNQPGFIVHVGNKIYCLRPLPVIAEPGLIDHF